MNRNEHEQPEDAIDGRLEAAFDRLAADASGVDTMAALRSVESPRRRRAGVLAPVLAAGALAAVLVLGGMLFRGRASSTAVTTDGPVASATSVPTTAADVVEAPSAIATVTPVATPPLPAPTAVATPEPVPEPSATAERVPATVTPTVAPGVTSTPEPTPLAATEVTVEPTTTPPTYDADGAATFEGTWALRSIGGEQVDVGDNSPRIQVFAEGRLNARSGCWLAGAAIQTDGDALLQVQPGSESVSPALCSNSEAATPELLLRLPILEEASIRPDGSLIWNSADGFSTVWSATTGAVVGNPVEPAPYPTTLPGALENSVVFSYNTRAFAGPWRWIDVPGENSGVTLHLTTTGELTISSGCHEFIGRLQANRAGELRLPQDARLTQATTCEAPMSDQLSYLMDNVVHARSATVEEEQLRWLVPSTGEVLVFERE